LVKLGGVGRLWRAYGAVLAWRKRLFAGLVASTLATTALAEPVTLAALGDSLTQGFGLAEAQGFVPQLDAWLDAQGADEVDLINAGVSGDTTAGGLARVAWTLTDDVDGVIVALGGNDVLRGIDPAVSRANLDGIVREITAQGLPVLLVGISAPGNYGPDYKSEFEAIYPELGATYDVQVFADFLGPITEGRTLQEAQALMQSDGLHPNASGVAMVVEALGPLVLDLVARARSN